MSRRARIFTGSFSYRSFGVKSAVAVNPATEIDFLDYVIEDLDMVLFMSVNPGFSGQKFIPSVLKKIDLFNRDTAAFKKRFYNAG
jgi:pentose-5-phosphate-3-epimerase